MAISKSTPYVRYKKDFTSSLHLGTIHIESEYLDRTQKTTIESIHGMTWHNKVVNENKELNLLSDTQLELTDLEKQYWNTGEKCVSVDEIHTLEEVEPNEDGTYTYTVNSMEGEYIEIYDGINNITSTSDGLDGQFEIVYDTTEEDINGNIALDQVVSQYEITDSGVGTITSAKSTGLTLVNHITESSKEEVVAIEQQDGRYFTIENTAQGNIKSAILKGHTLVNVNRSNFVANSDITGDYKNAILKFDIDMKASTTYTVIGYSDNQYEYRLSEMRNQGVIEAGLGVFKVGVPYILNTDSSCSGLRGYLKGTVLTIPKGTEVKILIVEGDYTNIDIPFFEGMQSVKMPVLTTSNEDGTKTNILTVNEDIELRGIGEVKDTLDCLTGKVNHHIKEIVLDGVNNKFTGQNANGEYNDGRPRFEIIIDDMYIERTNDWNDTSKLVISDKFKAGFFPNFAKNKEGNVIFNWGNYLCIIFEDATITTVTQANEYLQQNPITIQYRLASESIKTVDLTVQNQDGGTIPHIQTQPTTTHVSTSSDGLTPVVEMSCSYDTIIKPNTTYTIKLDRPIVSDTMYLQVDLGGTMMMLDADVNAFTIKTPSTLSHSQLRLSGVGNTVKEIIVLEGNRVNDKIEYFEGMKNVENPILVVSNCPYVFGKGEGVTFKKYQTTTLSLNEPIQLRSIGDVHDEINYETGEYIQRIGEIVLDGSESWDKWGTSSFLYKGSIRVNATNNKILSDKLPIVNYGDIYNCTTYGIGSGYGNIGIRINNVASVKDLIMFLSQNPITVQYQLAQPIITKIDTTILDQNNSYKSSQQTYDESTYISVQSDTVVTPSSSVDYEIYSSTGTVTGTSATIENAEAGTPVSGVVYGETLLNVIQEPSEDEYVIIGDNFEEQSGTLENTVEGNIKSAILKGRTEIENLLSSSTIVTAQITGLNRVNNDFTWSSNQAWSKLGFIINGKPNTVYYVSYDDISTNLMFFVRHSNNLTATATAVVITNKQGSFTTNSNGIFTIDIEPNNNDSSCFVKNLVITDGMKSVNLYPNQTVLKTIGKNLFNKKGLVLRNNNRVREDNGEFVYSSAASGFDNYFDCQFLQGKTIRVSSIATSDRGGEIAFYTIDKTYITGGRLAYSYLVPENAFYYRFSINVLNTSIDEANIQIEVNSVATLYEPYKSTTVIVNEPVELRGIGDVQDTLDLMTGELTERIGEIVLDGGEGWSTYTTKEDTISFIGSNIADAINKQYDSTNLMADKLIASGYGAWTKANNITLNTKKISICVLKSVLEEVNVNGFKKWLSENPIKVQYIKADEPIKTVDLSILDQDDKPIDNLHTFDTTTHINTYAQGGGLIPFINIPENISYDTILKANTQYTIKLNRTNIVEGTPLTVNLGGIELSIEDNTDSFTITTPSTLTNNTLSIGGANNKVKEAMVIEGDYVDRDLDFFEGFISVENPIMNIYHDMDNINFYGMVKWKKGNEYSELCRLPIKGQTIWYKVSGFMWNYVQYYDKDKNYLGQETNQGMGGGYQLNNGLLKPELKSKAVYFSINKRGNPTNGGYPQLRTKNNAPEIPPTPLSEICRLMTYPQITLRSIGDIKDEWDVVGETVTRRIGEIVLDGNSGYHSALFSVGNNTVYMQWFDNVNQKIPSMKINSKLLCDRLPNLEAHLTDIEGIDCHTINGNLHFNISKDKLTGYNLTFEGMKQYLNDNPLLILYELETPVTESVRITPPNPQTSTASITIPTQLNHVADTSDFLVWNPYKEHYVRYNYVEDGVVLDNYTWENLTDLNERQFVEFYNRRTYIDQPYHNYVASHDSKGTSKYVLIEPNQDYTVSVRFSELPTCETVKVNLGGAEVEMNVNDPHVHVTTPNTLVNNLCSISGDGLDGKVTDILVIHCLEHEGFADIDYFEGIDGIGEIVEVDGVSKVNITMEQTNGNLIDAPLEIYQSGNGLRLSKSMSVRPNKEYVFRTHKNMSIEEIDKDGNKVKNLVYGNNDVLYTQTNTNKININASNTYSNGNGSTHIYHSIELCYKGMEKDYIRPRYYDKEEILLPIQLHRINTVYDNFYYDEIKGFYRIQQSIGHKYFVGADSENWTLIERGQRVLRFRYNNADIQMKSLGEYMTNLLPNGTASSPYESCTFNGTTFIVSFDIERFEIISLEQFKLWLSEHPLHLYYQLMTPIMVDLPQYNKRIEFNTYKDEIYTFFKNCKPTVFTLSVPLDQTYRFYELEQGGGYANRVELTDERMTDEDTLYVDTIHGSGFSNLIENPNNVETLLKPNYQGKAVSHTLTNGKVSSIKVHGFEPNETTIANYNSTLKQYELIVQAQKGQNINTQTLAVPYKLEVYEDGIKDKVYYDEQNKLFRFEGGSVTNPSYNNSYIFNTPLEVFKGIAPRTGLIAEIKVKFNSGTTSARIYYSLDGGATTAYSTLRSMTDEVEYYIGFFNTGGTKLDYATKLSAEAEYINLAPLSSTLPESLIITQIQNISECTFILDKTYYFDSWIKPLELDVYNGETIITEQSGAIVTINNNGLHKDALTYTDETYTVYWTYVGGEGNVTITLGGTKVEVVGTQGYATLKTAIDGVQDGLIIGGYNLSIKDLMLVKGERIEDLAYFEGSRAVGTAFVDENGETKYKITLVTGSELINDKFENGITFEDNNKHNVVVTKLLGNKPNKK